MTPPTLESIREKWLKSDYAQAIKNTDIIIDNFRGQPIGYHKSADIIADFFISEFKALDVSRLGQVERWFLRLHNEPNLWTVEQALENVKKLFIHE